MPIDQTEAAVPMTLLERVENKMSLEGFSERRGVYSGAMLEGADLQGATLRHCNFSRANLNYANLQESCFCYCDFSHADLSHARCNRADLSSSNLSFANLRGVDFYRAALRHVNFYGAEIEYAELEAVNWSGAMNFRAVSGVGEHRRILYAVAHPKSDENKLGIKFKAGCFWGTAPELIEAIDYKYGDSDPDYLDTVKSLVKWRKSLGKDGEQ